MTTETHPDHIRRPHMRPIQPMPFRKEGKMLVALRDPMMLSKQTMIVPPQTLQALQAFRGELTLDQLAEQFSAPLDQVTKLAEGLDRVGLLWGPTFEKLEEDCKQRLEESGHFPVAASGMLGKDEHECRKAIESYIEQTEDPEIEEPIVALIAPHLDYERGWPNFAAAYYGLKNAEKPDRVVILGTNHFGIGDGVVGTSYGFQSPMGACPADEAVTGKLTEKFGKAYTIDQLDHLPEHSIELQLPWIQYYFGNVPIVAALVPDPLSEMIEDDESERVTTEEFVSALREVLDDVGGKTFFVASSDLSHVGPQFGEPRPVDDQRRFDVERHDRDVLSKYLTGDPDEFLSAMRWNKNPTRWCSVGNMSALLTLVGPEALEMIDYRQACDEKGNALVSSAAITLH